MGAAGEATNVAHNIVSKHIKVLKNVISKSLESQLKLFATKCSSFAEVQAERGSKWYF